jgi:parvulin-like peptidyl-prolyl isomerase
LRLGNKKQEFKKMRYINSAIFLITILIFSGISAFGQETETRVVDEVIAQVNESVVTLSQVNREIGDTVEAILAQNPNKPREEAEAEVKAKRGNLIANIINEELLAQQAKEYGYDSQVEAEINQRFLQQMKQLNIKTLEELYKQMEAQGINPDDIRELWRKQITTDLVLQREVDSRVYQGWKPKEIKAYYEANKSKFQTPETVTISEIFLNFAGLNEADVRKKALDIIAKARAGEDFGELAVQNSDRPNINETKGKVGELKVSEIDAKFADSLKNLKAGEVSEPIELDGVGIEILRVDSRSKASTESKFDETEVRRAMTLDVLAEKRKEYMIKLRSDSYIKIRDEYRPEVSPLLYADERSTEGKKKNPGK